MTPDVASTQWQSLAAVAAASATVDRFDPDTLAGLPEPAQRLLGAALPAGTPLVGAVELEMRGRIKLVRPWFDFGARQLLVAGVGFVWAPVVGGRLVRFVGADELGPDGARMEFRLHGRLPVVRASGPDVERSAAGRLAAETVAWLPQALAPQSGATWRPRSDDRATVTLAGPSGPIDVDVTVDRTGRLTELGLQRWNDSSSPPAPEPFGGVVSETVEASGVRVAGEGAVGWQYGTPSAAEAVFFRYRITRAEFGAGSP
jgi:hypothetical protein